MSDNIFKDIRKLIFEQSNDYLNIRDDHEQLIKNFLKNPNQRTTLKLFKFIGKIHEKDRVFGYMDDLQLYERGFSKIIPEHREHYLHSASVYVLGLGLYNSCQSLREALITERHEAESYAQKTSFLFRWSMAACLHDIAYPLELSLKSFNAFSKKIHKLTDTAEFSFVNIRNDIYGHLNLLTILKPNDNILVNRKDTALGLIANHLTSHQNRRPPVTYETLLNLLYNYLNINLSNGRIDHGIFSSLILLNRVHELYKTNHQWDINNFYFEVVDSATAIFLHNVYKHSPLKDIFGNGKFNYDYPSALGYLLYLSDTLCEWLRGPKLDMEDIEHFGVRVEADQVYFNIPRKIGKKIEKATELFDDRLPIIISYA